MDVTIYSRRHRQLNITIPNEWSDFLFYIILGIFCLILSAKFAKVRIGSFPANPLYWHVWLIANAEKPPLISENLPPRIYRFYMFLWAGSISSFIYSLAILVSIFTKYNS